MQLPKIFRGKKYKYNPKSWEFDAICDKKRNPKYQKIHIGDIVVGDGNVWDSTIHTWVKTESGDRVLVNCSSLYLVAEPAPIIEKKKIEKELVGAKK